mgnify:CR=1 FL=1
MSWIIIISFFFFILVGLDWVPYLRGPAPYPPEWQWAYLFVNPGRKIWLPFILIFFSLWFFYHLDNKKEQEIKKKENIFLILLIILGFFIQVLFLIYSRSGLAVLFHRIAHPYINGYFSAGIDITDPINFLRQFNDIVLSLPSHAKSHPPGGVIFFWLINQLIVKMPSFLVNFVNNFSPKRDDVFLLWQSLTASQRLTAIVSPFLIMFLSNLTIAPFYYLGKSLYGRKTALRSLFLYLFLPSLILFVPILDVFYPFFAVLSAYFFIKGIKTKKLSAFFFSGVILSLGIFFSLSLLPIFLFLTLFFLFDYLAKHLLSSKAFFPYVKKYLFFVLGFLSLPLALYLFFYFNFIEVTKTILTDLPKRNYFLWLFYNLYDFFIFQGIPAMIIVIISTKEMIFNFLRKKIKHDIFWLSFVLMLFIVNILGTIKGEVARIWLPFAPFSLLWIIYYLSKRLKFNQRLFFIFLAIQAVQVVIFQTFWVALW